MVLLFYYCHCDALGIHVWFSAHPAGITPSSYIQLFTVPNKPGIKRNRPKCHTM